MYYGRENVIKNIGLVVHEIFHILGINSSLY